MEVNLMLFERNTSYFSSKANSKTVRDYTNILLLLV